MPLDADTGRVTPVRVPRGDAEGSTVQRSDQGASGFAYVGYRGPWGWAWMEYLR